MVRLYACVGCGVLYLLSVLHFVARCTHVLLFEFPDGHRWYTSADCVPILKPGEPTWGPDVHVKHAESADYDIGFEPGTRRISRAQFTQSYFGEPADELVLEPILSFPLKGIGYLNPNWLHCYDRGQYAEGPDGG